MNNSKPLITLENLPSHLPASLKRSYSLMYSSWLGGWTADPRLMMIPIDDHMVHRGDGVFEALKAVNGKIYLLKPHLERMRLSAESIGLKPFENWPRVEQIVSETWAMAKANGQSEAIVRIFLSRGPGNFSTNPYDTDGSQLYVMITELKPFPKQQATVGWSQIPVKSDWLAVVKSCNYLPNVMMKKEALDRGVDFTVSKDADGNLAEGSTENIALVDAAGNLVHPQLHRILKGCTMTRAFELAKPLISEGLLKSIQVRKITATELANAREIMMMGTTLDVLPVTEFEGTPVGDGKVGAVAARLNQLVIADQG